MARGCQDSDCVTVSDPNNKKELMHFLGLAGYYSTTYSRQMQIMFGLEEVKMLLGVAAVLIVLCFNLLTNLTLGGHWF